MITLPSPEPRHGSRTTSEASSLDPSAWTFTCPHATMSPPSSAPTTNLFQSRPSGFRRSFLIIPLMDCRSSELAPRKTTVSGEDPTDSYFTGWFKSSPLSEKPRSKLQGILAFSHKYSTEKTFLAISLMHYFGDEYKYQASFSISSIICFTSCGLACPDVFCMTWPTNQPASEVFPPL